MLNLKKFFSVSLISGALLLQGCLENAGNTASSSTPLTTNTSSSGLSVSDSVISLDFASSTTAGALAASDYVSFSNKEPALGSPTVNGMILSSTTTGTRSWVEGNSLSDPSTALRFYDDFLTAAPLVATSFGQMGWMATVSGAAALCSAASVGADNGHPGQITCTSGTTATGRSALSTPVNAIALGGGVIDLTMLVQIPILSAGGQTLTTYFGLADNSAAGNAVDGVYFIHDFNSANWQIVTANNSTRTNSDSGIAVVAATWTKLRILVSADGLSAQYFIDGVEAGNSPISTNLPGAGRDFGVLMKIEKAVGITARTYLVDYVSLVQTFTTAR